MSQSLIQIRICKHCQKAEGEHSATKRECPVGRKHRTMGYMQYGPRVFEFGKVITKKVKLGFTL